MSTEKTPPEVTAEEETPSSKESKKRSVYPSRGLKDIIEFVGKVYNQLGHTSFLSNKAVATVHGLSPDSIKQQLSSAQQYKLFELKHGIGYRVTDHFQKLFLPKNDGEKRAAVIESLKHSEAYQQLFKDYEYHIVPPDGVKNHFIRNFGFKEEVANKAAQIFLDNLKDFKLLDNRGVLTSALPSKPNVSEAIEVPPAESSQNGVNQEYHENQLPEVRRSEKIIFQSEIDRDGKKTIPIYLTDEKQAVFVYPDEITEDDIELVKHQVEGILMRIKLEAKKRAASAAQSK